jgi:uncharacterized protein
MTIARAEPLSITQGDTRLFALHRPAASPLRAAVLVCAPFFHEQILSYRLLSQVTEKLAALGIASLRFDYRGAGDSDGDGREFSLDAANDDTERAYETLRALAPRVPIIAFGARAGAWPAATLAVQHGLRLWLWQPVVDGAAWLAELRRLDEAERASRSRYPYASAPKPADPDHLVGAYCPPALQDAIAKVRLADLIGDAPIAIDTVLDASAPAFARASRELRLPEDASRWYGGANMQAVFFTRPLAAIVDTLAGSIA